MKRESLIAIVLATGVGGTTFAGSIVAFDSSNANLGTITAFSSASSISATYAYSNSQYNGSDPSQGTLVANALNIFFVNTNEGLALFGVFNNGVDGGAGVDNNFAATLTYSQSETMKVEDDNENGSWGVGSTGTTFSLTYNWLANFTDGWASTFTNQVGSKFELSSIVKSNGLTQIVYHSGDGATPISTTNFGDGVGAVIIPLPHPAGLAGFGLLGVAIMRRRR